MQCLHQFRFNNRDKKNVVGKTKGWVNSTVEYRQNGKVKNKVKGKFNSRVKGMFNGKVKGWVKETLR